MSAQYFFMIITLLFSLCNLHVIFYFLSDSGEQLKPNYQLMVIIIIAAAI